MKAKILDINGKEKGTIELPKAFSEKIREDIVMKVLESKKSQQPYSPSPVAGKQHSAKGKTVHRRHVWRSGYGRGASRVPRKIFSQKGSQFNWEAAEVPHARGGMRAHPPKILSMINTLKINKKEQKVAMQSALSATANSKEVSKKYERLNNKKIEVPFIVENKISSLKTKQVLEAVKKILGKEIFEIAIKNKSVRAGQGTKRGRKYKSTAGMLLVISDKEKLKINAFDVVPVKKLSIVNLAKGGLGRLTIYTEDAIKELNESSKEK